MWIIIAIVTGAIAFGGKPHDFYSFRHFATKAECDAYIPKDAMELVSELKEGGVDGPFVINSHCEIDTDGDPA